MTLRDSGVKFAVVDPPEADDLTVGIVALAAQQMGGRAGGCPGAGRELGNPNGAASLRQCQNPLVVACPRSPP